MEPKKPKKHRCKTCEKVHVDELQSWPVAAFTYQMIGGQVYISAPSVFRMFCRMGLESIALRFMKTVNEIYFEKQ